MIRNILFSRLVGVLILCCAAPPLLCHYLGPAVGTLAAAGAAGLWYSQYRFEAWTQRRDACFWFVASGYGFIALTLVVCLARLVRVI